MELFSKTISEETLNTKEPDSHSTPGNSPNPESSNLEIPPSISPIPLSSKILGFETANEDDAILIDQYVNQEIKRRGWEDSMKSYQDLCNELLQVVGTDENTLGYNKFLKVLNLIKFLTK